MLYRRHLRIKVLQALYSWYSGSITDLPSGEKQLFQSIDKLYELFIYQLSFLLEVKEFALTRMELNKKKYFPTEDDLNPNHKFVRNQALKFLEENKDFQKKAALFKVNWKQEQDMILKFYKLLRDADFYKEYLADTHISLEEDKKFLIKVVDRLMTDFDLLKSYYEEKSVYFSEGYDLEGVLLIKFFDGISSKFNSGAALPEIYSTSGQKVNDDKIFVQKLFRKVILNDEENSEIIRAKSKSWDYERIPMLDVILLKMAIVELKVMETIPVKVTLNEYIELAKYFSTPKSKTFINGVLDKLIGEFKADGTIKKTGRGLIE
ncbi:MAG: N utilization substance protein B [bacterium]|nr:MAG: N utilization substance protein B [bacterium]